MTNYDFAMKHRQAFIVYCQASHQCANPHDSKMTALFRMDVEKKLNAMRKGRTACSKPKGYAMIGKGKSTVTPSSAAPATANTFAIRDTAKPRKPAGLVFDNATGCFI